MIVLVLFLLFIAAMVGLAYLTNPFNRWHIIKRPYIVHEKDGVLVATDNTDRILVHQAWPFRTFAIIKCGIHIITTRYLHSPRSASVTAKQVIKDVRAYRFNPDYQLLISGDHFSPLFVRNLGVFYYPTLDTNINDTKSDWTNRQIIYLQTVAYALSVFDKSPEPTTTIVQTGPYSATCVNFYAYPSDTVYGILYALAVLTGKQPAEPWAYGKPRHQLQTQELAGQLLADYHGTLIMLYENYRDQVFDKQTGMISTNIHMSGAKDITRRQSAFYDNVIFWKTTELAMTLGLVPQDKAFLRTLKQRIIKTFWLEEEGYFVEDLSEEGLEGKYYSSDWLIVLATGFLDPAKTLERPYFERSVAYMRANGIDEPMAVRYQQDTRAGRQFFAVRLAVASYGGDAVWSFWGMEYMKVLLRLYELTSRQDYLSLADKHIKLYKQAMVRDGGFPEVFDGKGKMLQTPLYRSVRQTGWVIGFEQVLAMRRATGKE